MSNALDPDARAAVVGELQDNRRRLLTDLVETERELAQLGEGRRMDIFKSTVGGYSLVIMLDERLADCTDMGVREDVALSLDAASRWLRRPGELT
jgi:hypothetical protein